MVWPENPCLNLQGLSNFLLGGVLGKTACYTAAENLMRKVLDFIQFGGPDLTVGSTIFEMWMGL